MANPKPGEGGPQAEDSGKSRSLSQKAARWQASFLLGGGQSLFCLGLQLIGRDPPHSGGRSASFQVHRLKCHSQLKKKRKKKKAFTETAGIISGQRGPAKVTLISQHKWIKSGRGRGNSIPPEALAEWVARVRWGVRTALHGHSRGAAPSQAALWLRPPA